MDNNIYRGQKPQIDDFINVLPSSNKVINLSDGGVITNCVGSSHEDKNPSMGIKQGDNNVIVKCFSKDCSKQDLLSYFYDRIPYFKNKGGKHDR